jgi:outer membrane protease
MRRILFCLTLFFLPFSLFAQHALQLEGYQFPGTDPGQGNGNPITFHIGIESGALFGMINEWVFKDVKANQSFDFTVSRLDWQLDPLFYIGAVGSVKPCPRFYIGFGGWLGLPGLFGYLEDRDWDETTGDYIVFSHHDNVLVNAQFADINIGYSFLEENTLILNGIIGFNFKRIYMSGRNGWQEDPPGTVTSVYTYEVITYELYFFTPYLALEAAWAPVPLLTIDAFLSASPFLTFAYAHDKHVGGHVYDDFPQFGFSFSAVLCLSLHLGAGYDLRLKNYFVWIPPFKGRDYQDNNFQSSVKGGASLITYGVSLSIVTGLAL